RSDRIVDPVASGQEPLEHETTGLGECHAARRALARPRRREWSSQGRVGALQITPGVAIGPADLLRRAQERAVLEHAEQELQAAVADDEAAGTLDPHLRLEHRAAQDIRPGEALITRKCRHAAILPGSAKIPPR